MMPFEPTGVGEGGFEPAVCWACGQRACGVGVGTKRWGKGDCRWICEECKPIVEKLAKTSHAKLDILEMEALNGGVDAVGDWIEVKGITDLALMDELDARMIVKAAWRGCANRLRELVKEEMT